MISATSQSSASEERSSSWRLAGTIAPLPDPFRVNNYDCAITRRGPMRHLAHVGDCVRISGDDAPASLFRRMWITAIDPVGGDQQSWLPGDNEYKATSEIPSFTLGYGSTDETVATVTITRAGGATTLTGYEGSPFPLSLAKDVYTYEEIEDEDAGTKALHFKFSHLHLTAASADYLLHCVIETSLWTYEFDLNLLTDIIWGVASLRKTYTFDRDIASVSIAGMTRSTTVPSNRADWSATEYYVEETSSTTWTINYPAQQAGRRIYLTFTLASDFPGTEAEYYDAYIGTLHGASIPTLEIGGETYEDWGCRGCVLTVKDENDLLNDWDATGDLVGKTIAIRSDGAAHWDGLTVKQATADSVDADVTLTAGTDYTWFGAEGELWGKSALPVGDCLYLNLKLANRKSMVTQAGFDTIRECLENMLEA